MDSSPPPAAPGAMPGQMGRRRFKAEGTALSGSTSGQWEISLGLKWLMIELWAIGTEDRGGRAVVPRDRPAAVQRCANDPPLDQRTFVAVLGYVSASDGAVHFGVRSFTSSSLTPEKTFWYHRLADIRVLSSLPTALSINMCSMPH